MSRLFVAIGLPPFATEELAAIQPPAVAGVRLEKTSQMHVTLHFLGNANVERMAMALATVQAPLFSMAIQGVGQFPSADGGAILWARVRESRELLELHAAIAAALAGEGFRPEERPYTPHVTLARCGAKGTDKVANDFLTCGMALSLGDIVVTDFGLYSSVSVGGASFYQRERSFPLRMVLGEG
jgi:2'-5' RNA ligase